MSLSKIVLSAVSALLIGALLCGCAEKKDPEVTENSEALQDLTESGEPSQKPEQKPENEEAKEAEDILPQCLVEMTDVPYSDEGIYFAGALNSEKMFLSSVLHLPIGKRETKEELDSYIARIAPEGEYNSHDADFLTFFEKAAEFDENYFEKYTLLTVTVAAPSGSFRYGVDSIMKKDGGLVVHVVKTNDPEAYTADMREWLVAVSVPKALLSDVTAYDADLGNTGR